MESASTRAVADAAEASASRVLTSSSNRRTAKAPRRHRPIRAAAPPVLRQDDPASMMGMNGTRAAARPAVSLIVVSNGEVGADASLEMLRQKCAASDAELIVVRAGDRQAGESGAGSADVVFVDRPAGTPLAELRAAGMRVARGDVVALTDDRSATATSRLAHLLACYRRDTGDRTLSHSR